ncbi:hypothetical protein CB0940_11837 [Cercospora beticola]|uniref:Uncharacterized protein n=1 Tax=Cercospora beticola TaxID=122368 RepID=A0A2G5IEL9_CERBT|nr:hypothetical protein CB0940_11837 [Cercospora beticola]PIB02964.1 hypothetical protein CB0940_11837 [Cercospora beticola]WPB04196.1 hypothetical protein RHO25_008841 [Cercospora beticola]CAK1356996.1 unnamed protein product [Cercospora beticola]
MSKVAPSARTWTLRFKNHTSTILLEVDPLQSLSDVRAELLHALVETSPGGKLNGQEIPQNAKHIKLGIANDRNDLSKGYSSVVGELEEASDTGKGKGKAPVGSAKADSLKDCPQGVGMKNGDVVAFKFVGNGGIADESTEDIIEEWDVIVPTIEDTYKEDDEGLAMDEG